MSKKRQRKKYNGKVKRPNPPSISRIVTAQWALLERLEIPMEEAHEMCWGCYDLAPLQRAHILPWAFYHDNSPQNCFLLCKDCHNNQPDGQPREVQILWLEMREDRISVIVRKACLLGEALEEASINICGTVQGAELWADQLDHATLLRALKEGADKSAAQRMSTAVANMHWGIIAEFRRWFVGGPSLS